MAVTVGSLSTLKAVLSEGMIDINQIDPDGWTPVMIAADRGFGRIVRFLMDNGADVSIASNDGVMALMLASQGGHLSIVNALLVGNANPQATNCEGYTSLHVAAAAGHLRVMKALLEAGANRDSRMTNGDATVLGEHERAAGRRARPSSCRGRSAVGKSDFVMGEGDSAGRGGAGRAHGSRTRVYPAAGDQGVQRPKLRRGSIQAGRTVPAHGDHDHADRGWSG